MFDGKAPKLKSGELAKRAERRDEAKEKLTEAKELQNVADIQRFNKRLVRVTGKHNADCKRLLELLGIPIVQAPSEAEAQCAQLCKEGLVYAAATEDMDSLTFGCPRLVRNLTSANNDKVKEFVLEKTLSGLGLNQQQFIDLSILMGCDYCESIRGIGGKKGLEMIKTHGSIEGMLKNVFGVNEFVDVEIEYRTRTKPKEEEEVKEEDKTDIVDKEAVDEKEQSEDGKENIKQEVVVKEEEEVEMAPADKREVIEPVKEEIKQEDISLDEELIEEVGDEDNEAEEDEEKNDNDDGDDDGDNKPKTTQAKGGKKKGKRELTVPEAWPFRGARKLFEEPLVLRGELKESDLRMKDADEEGVIKFLVEENGFSEERVRGALKRIKNCKAKGSQTRIDSFFKASPAAVQNAANKNNSNNKQGQKRDNKGKLPTPAAKRGRGRPK